MVGSISKNSFKKEVVKCIDFVFTIIYKEDKLNKGNQGPSLCSFDLIQSSIFTFDESRKIIKVVHINGRPCIISRPSKITAQHIQ